MGFEDIKSTKRSFVLFIINYYLFDLEVRLNTNNEPAANNTDATIVKIVVFDDSPVSGKTLACS